MKYKVLLFVVVVVVLVFVVEPKPYCLQGYEQAGSVCKAVLAETVPEEVALVYPDSLALPRFAVGVLAFVGIFYGDKITSWKPAFTKPKKYKLGLVELEEDGREFSKKMAFVNVEKEIKSPEDRILTPVMDYQKLIDRHFSNSLQEAGSWYVPEKFSGKYLSLKEGEPIVRETLSKNMKKSISDFKGLNFGFMWIPTELKKEVM